MNKIANSEVARQLEEGAAAELQAIRTALTGAIDKYKGAWHYRRKLHIYNNAFEIDPNNTPMHARMVNVRELEDILANQALNATQLIGAVETYLNKGNNFSWAKASPLRRALNAQAKKQRKEHKLTQVDLYLSLMVVAPAAAPPVVAPGAADVPGDALLDGLVAAPAPMAVPDDVEAPPPPPPFPPERDDDAMEVAQAAMVADFERRSAEQQAQVADLQQRLDVANAELAGAQDTIVNLRQNIAQKDEALGQAQRAIKQKTREIGQLNARLETKQQVIDQQRSTINGQKTLLQDLLVKFDAFSNSTLESMKSFFKMFEDTSADLIMATSGRKTEDVKKTGARKPESKKDKGFSPFKGLTKEGRAEKEAEKRRNEAKMQDKERAKAFRADIQLQFDKGEGPTYERIADLTSNIEKIENKFLQSTDEIAKAFSAGLELYQSDTDDTAAPSTSSLSDSDGEISSVLESFDEPTSPGVHRFPMHVPAQISDASMQAAVGIAPPPAPFFDEQKASEVTKKLSNNRQSMLPRLGELTHSKNTAQEAEHSLGAPVAGQSDDSDLSKALNSVKLRKAVTPTAPPEKKEYSNAFAEMLASSAAITRAAMYHLSDDEKSDTDAAINGW